MSSHLDRYALGSECIKALVQYPSDNGSMNTEVSGRIIHAGKVETIQSNSCRIAPMLSSDLIQSAF